VPEIELLPADTVIGFVATVVMLVLAGALIAIHVATAGLSIAHLRGWFAQRPAASRAPLTIVRPLSGLEASSRASLQSTFAVLDKDTRVMFCVASRNDPIVPLVTEVMAEYPAAPARLLIGDQKISANPKLNNLVKAWPELETEWVVFVDSNVVLTTDAVEQMFAAAAPGVGMVCAPPIGSCRDGGWAELECAFLNGYQARWQLAVSAIGMGFAQGKVMFFHRSLLDRAGGLRALAGEPAEDAAATKLIRMGRQTIRVVQRPFEQQLGTRTFHQVWSRQLRWAQLRRATFPHLFLPELLTGALVPGLALSAGLAGLGLPVLPGLLIFGVLWYGLELAVCRAGGWHLSWRTVPSSILRDAMIPAIWLAAIFYNTFEWQGHVMRVDDTGTDPTSTPA
jgi:ceramide glucosyltransferase